MQQKYLLVRIERFHIAEFSDPSDLSADLASALERALDGDDDAVSELGQFFSGYLVTQGIDWVSDALEIDVDETPEIEAEVIQIMSVSLDELGRYQFTADMAIPIPLRDEIEDLESWAEDQDVYLSDLPMVRLIHEDDTLDLTMEEHCGISFVVSDSPEEGI